MLSAKIFDKPKIVGILNLTPDSFSDGNKYFDETNALKQLNKMLEEGADIIDIGAESTRPNAQILSAKQEISRLEKVLPKLVEALKKFNSHNNKKVEISIDTYHYETVVFAHDLGINFINDISGLIDERIVDFVAKKNLKAILMHNLAIHANPNIIINRELNVFEEITQWAQQKIEFLMARNIKKSQLIFDPGIGFSKDAEQSIRILKNIKAYRCLGLEIYVGHSKKSFLDKIILSESETPEKSRSQTESDAQGDKILKRDLDRDEKTLIISQYLAQKKVDYIRVHDVAKNIEAIEKGFSSRFERDF